MKNELKVEMRKKLVRELQEFAAKLGPAPSLKEIKEARIYTDYAIVKYFGSLNAFKKAAGLPTGRLSLSREQCMEELKRMTRKLKRLPSWDDLALYGKYSPMRIMSKVGGVKEIARMNELRQMLGYQLV